MKKILPKTKNNPHGFTLIELLVVVSIIAILSVIGIVVYGNVQQGARDARRKADIDSIANAMEVNRTTAGVYTALAAAHFQSGTVPLDPLDSQNRCGTSNTQLCRYCVVSQGTSVTVPTTTFGTCATTVGVGAPAGGTSSPAWAICTNLETTSGVNSTRYYCRINSQ